MKVLFVVHQFFPEFAGGTELVTLGIAKAMQKAGHSVRVLSCKVDRNKTAGDLNQHLSYAIDTVYEGVPVTLLKRDSLPSTADFSLDIDLQIVSDLVSWYKAEQFDIIHCTHSMRMVSALFAANQLSIPVILTLTDFFLPCFRINYVNTDRNLCGGPCAGKQCASSCNVAPWTHTSLVGRYEVARSLLAASAERVVPSEFLAEKFRLAFPDISFRVIPHGLDVLSHLAAEHSVRATLVSRTTDTFNLTYVGTIVPQKGLDVLLRALAQIPSASLKLAIAGPFGSDKAYEAEVRSLIQRDARIVLLGPLDRPDISRLFLNTDLLCLPSQVPESFSLTLREASLFGVPAIVSDLGAQSEFIRSTRAGDIASASDANDWALRIEDILKNPSRIAMWKALLPIPMRIEEEAFLYQSLYQAHILN